MCVRACERGGLSTLLLASTIYIQKYCRVTTSNLKAGRYALWVLDGTTKVDFTALVVEVVKSTLLNKSCSNQKINATLLFPF